MKIQAATILCNSKLSSNGTRSLRNVPLSLYTHSPGWLYVLGCLVLGVGRLVLRFLAEGKVRGGGREYFVMKFRLTVRRMNAELN